MAELGATTYFAGHPLWHQQEWIKNGSNEFSCDFKPMVDSEVVFINGIALSKLREQNYWVSNQKLYLAEDCGVEEGDVIKIVYAWR